MSAFLCSKGRIYNPVEQSNLAPYQDGAVSLPESVVGSPLLFDLLPLGICEDLKGYKDKVLRSHDERLALDDRSPGANAYVDPVLANNTQAYRKYILDLRIRRMVN